MCCGSQPVLGPTERLSSSAFRKAWPTKGLSLPAQASQSAAGISSIRPTVRRPWTPAFARESRSWFQATPLGDLEDRLDLDGDVERQHVDADGRTRVLAGIAEHVDHGVGSAVRHLRLVGEVVGRVDEDGELGDALDAVEIAEGV